MIQRFILFLIIFLSFSNLINGQTCGPNCPACSGTTDGSLVPLKSISLQGMYIPNEEEEYGIMSLKYGAFNWLDLGLGYTFKAEKIIWNARIQALKQNEDTWKPSIILGTGSIRTGSSDQSIYLNVLKSIEFSEKFAIGLSGGVATLASDLEKYYGIGNVSFIFFERITTYVNFDGISFHEGIAWNINDWFTAGFLLVESKDPALTVNITLPLFKSKSAEND